MTNKVYSKVVKIGIAVAAVGASICKWYNLLPNATILEIWQVAAFAYGIALGTMDFNIIVDNFKEKKTEC
jgi:hypothetical protein